jgi:hypothetical protein
VMAADESGGSPDCDGGIRAGGGSVPRRRGPGDWTVQDHASLV